MTAADPQDEVLLLERRYPEPVDDVWAAITESDRLARWAGSYTGTGRAGGTVEVTWTGEVDAGGEVAPPVTVTIHECDPPTRLVVEIPLGPDAWHITVTLGPDGDRPGGTHLTFEQRLLPSMSRKEVEAGWRWYLDKLGASLSGAPVPDWQAYWPPD
jgi:uncharacterized protein YndB with AHSA1/START domain